MVTWLSLHLTFWQESCALRWPHDISQMPATVIWWLCQHPYSFFILYSDPCVQWAAGRGTDAHPVMSNGGVPDLPQRPQLQTASEAIGSQWRQTEGEGPSPVETAKLRVGLASWRRWWTWVYCTSREEKPSRQRMDRGLWQAWDMKSESPKVEWGSEDRKEGCEFYGFPQSTTSIVLLFAQWLVMCDPESMR
jgi:hypothetical protein